MRFFIDTANIDEIRQANDMGIICGVTTNPSLIAKEGKDYKKTLKEITSIVDGPISGEVDARTEDAKGMIKEGRAGATYVSPFLGRLDDINMSGTDLIYEIAEIFEAAGDIDTQIIAASIRNTTHVTECAKAGAHIGTVPFKVLMQMAVHPLTTAGIEKFKADTSAASAS